MAAPMAIWRHDPTFTKSRDSLVPLFARSSISSSVVSVLSDELDYPMSPKERAPGNAQPMNIAGDAICNEPIEEDRSEGRRLMRRQSSRILYARRTSDQVDDLCTHSGGEKHGTETEDDRRYDGSKCKPLNCGRTAKVLFDYREQQRQQANDANCNGHSANGDVRGISAGGGAGRLKRNHSKVLYRRSPSEEVYVNPSAPTGSTSSSSPNSNLLDDSAVSTDAEATTSVAMAGSAWRNELRTKQESSADKEKPITNEHPSPRDKQNSAPRKKVLFAAPDGDQTDYYV